MTNENADNTGTTQTTDTGTQQGAAETTVVNAEVKDASATADAKQTDGNADQKTEGDDGKKDGEAKTDEGKKDEAKQGAPEKYEFKAIEGVTLDNAVVDQFSEVARELNLPQEAAQKILDKMAPAIAGRQAESLTALKADWLEQAKTDKEYGGAKFDENLAMVAKARDAFAQPALRELLDKTGLGNHPEVIRWFYKAGKAISEDKMVTNDNSNAETPRDTASVLFPNMKKTA